MEQKFGFDQGFQDQEMARHLVLQQFYVFSVQDLEGLCLKLTMIPCLLPKGISRNLKVRKSPTKAVAADLLGVEKCGRRCSLFLQSSTFLRT